MDTIKHDLIIRGDSYKTYELLQKESIDCIITSPPYWAKRIYNEEGELGTTGTPQEYVSQLCDYFDGIKPYLKNCANVFVNIGDTYFGSGAGAWSKYIDSNGNTTIYQKQLKETYFTTKPLQPKIKQDGKLFQNKQLLMIPARFAIEMQNRGWILREDIIWHKPNRIPSGVKDRMNNTYEHVFHFVKNKKYYFDLESIKTKGKNGIMKNPGDVWDINTQAIKGEHTATFPEELVKRLVLCGCPKNGVVLDPFLGSGTTWVVCSELQRSCVGVEINKGFVDFAIQRFKQRKEGSNYIR